MQSIARPSGRKDRVSLDIPIKIPKCMNWTVMSHPVDLLPGFNPVAVLHVVNPGSLKMSNGVGKFVAERLDFNFSE